MAPIVKTVKYNDGIVVMVTDDEKINAVTLNSIGVKIRELNNG